MDLRQLEAFVAVAEERNFTRGAARLHVAQSGLSATIRSLERELRAPLFSRTTRHVELTAAGAALFEEARRTLASAHAAVEAVAAVEGLRRGTLSIGIMQASALFFDLPGLLVRYRRAYPGIELRLQQASSVDLGRLLAEHNLDIVFSAGSAEASPGVVSIDIAQSPLVVICDASHELATKEVVDLRRLSDVTLVGHPLGWGIRTLSDLALRSRGVEPHYAFEVNDTSTLLDLVEAGLGVALLPEAIAAQRRSTLHRLTVSGQRWDWCITAETLSPGPSNPAAREFWTMLGAG